MRSRRWLELGDHVADRRFRLGRVEGLNRRPLRECRGAGRAVDHQRVHLPGDLHRHRAEAEAPAAHRPCLGKPVHVDGPFGHPVDPVEGDVLAVVAEAVVDLVAQHDEVVLDRQRGDPLAVVPREDAAGRVLRRVDDEHPRARGDERAELVDVGAEVVLLAQRQRDRLGADELDQRSVDRISRDRERSPRRPPPRGRAARTAAGSSSPGSARCSRSAVGTPVCRVT